MGVIKISNNCEYQNAGFNNRTDYLKAMADNFGIDKDTVFQMASLLGESEDFDGLIVALEDY